VFSKTLTLSAERGSLFTHDVNMWRMMSASLSVSKLFRRIDSMRSCGTPSSTTRCRHWSPIFAARCCSRLPSTEPVHLTRMNSSLLVRGGLGGQQTVPLVVLYCKSPPRNTFPPFRGRQLLTIQNDWIIRFQMITYHWEDFPISNVYQLQICSCIVMFRSKM